MMMMENHDFQCIYNSEIKNIVEITSIFKDHPACNPFLHQEKFEKTMIYSNNNNNQSSEINIEDIDRFYHFYYKRGNFCDDKNDYKMFFRVNCDKNISSPPLYVELTANCCVCGGFECKKNNYRGVIICSEYPMLMLNLCGEWIDENVQNLISNSVLNDYEQTLSHVRGEYYRLLLHTV